MTDDVLQGVVLTAPEDIDAILACRDCGGQQRNGRLGIWQAQCDQQAGDRDGRHADCVARAVVACHGGDARHRREASAAHDGQLCT